MLSAGRPGDALHADGPAIIVGGGLSALLLAQRLAQHQMPVVVLDKNAGFGGCNGRSGSGSPLICYKALGFEAGSSLARLLADAALWSNAPPLRMEVMDRVFFPGLELALPGRLADFQRELAQRYPAQQRALQTLGDAVQQVYAAIRDSAGRSAPPARQRALKLLHAFARQPYSDFLLEHFSDPELRKLLAVRAFSSSNSALTMLAYLGKMLIDGLYELPESGTALCDALVAQLQATPHCRLLPDTWADEILFDSNARACGVRLRSGEQLMGTVVLNADPGQVCEQLIRDTRIRHSLGSVTAASAVSLSALNIIFTLTPDLGRALGKYRSCARLFHSDDVDPFTVLAAREGGQLDLRNCKINLDFDPEGRARRAYVELDCSYHAAPFAEMQGREHAALDFVVNAVRQERLASLHADFGDGIDSVEILTPHDFALRTNHREGAASGFADTATGPRQLDRILAEHGLLQVGQWSAHGSGLSQLDASAVSAYAALRRARPGVVSTT